MNIQILVKYLDILFCNPNKHILFLVEDHWKMSLIFKKGWKQSKKSILTRFLTWAPPESWLKYTTDDINYKIQRGDAADQQFCYTRDFTEWVAQLWVTSFMNTPLVLLIKLAPDLKNNFNLKMI